MLDRYSTSQSLASTCTFEYPTAHELFWLLFYVDSMQLVAGQIAREVGVASVVKGLAQVGQALFNQLLGHFILRFFSRHFN